MRTLTKRIWEMLDSAILKTTDTRKMISRRAKKLVVRCTKLELTGRKINLNLRCSMAIRVSYKHLTKLSRTCNNRPSNQKKIVNESKLSRILGLTINLWLIKRK